MQPSMARLKGPVPTRWLATFLATGIVLGGGSVAAQESDGWFNLDFKGSLGEGRHERYVPPLTNPIFNETPFITTEARPIYFYHKIPNDFVTEGGHVHLAALQLRLALTERLGFIATKDGYADLNFNEVLSDEEGFANVALGFKYAILSEPETGTILTAGLRYEIPINDLETGGIELQGNGNGFLNPFITGARTFGKLGLQASFGGNFALDQDEDTSIIHYSAHADYELFPGFFPLVEINGFTAINNGNRSTGALSQLDGVDVLNFGSENRDTTVTVGGGARYRLNDHLQFGFGGETPITDKDNTIFDYRVYVDLVLSY
jgi:hypothetical protein